MQPFNKIRASVVLTLIKCELIQLVNAFFCTLSYSSVVKCINNECYYYLRREVYSIELATTHHAGKESYSFY